MRYKNKLLILAALVALAIPLMFTGNAGAVTSVDSNTYNTDAALQTSTGGWTLPQFFCIAPPSTWDPVGSPTPPRAQKQASPAPSSDPYAPSTCSKGSLMTSAQQTAFSNYFALANFANKTALMNACFGLGYSWSSYSGSCGPTAWTALDPDQQGTGVLPMVNLDSSGTTTANVYSDHKGCLRCHNTRYINGGGSGVGHYGDTWAMKESYMNGGHKNMVKPYIGNPLGYPTTVTTASATGASAVEVPYTVDSNGNAISFSSSLYWVWGGNGLEGTAPHTMTTAGGSYSCARCHTAGWTSDATLAAGANKEPQATFTGISIGTSAGQVNLKGGVSGDSNSYASWDRFGIQCSRCHVATSAGDNGNPGELSGGHTTWPETTSTGGDVTALCMNCHRQEASGVPDVISGAGVIPANSPASTLVIGGNPVAFVSHSHGTQFLNSPHARMTGTWNQIGCPPVSISPAGTTGCDDSMSTYNTDFSTAALADGLSQAGSFTFNTAKTATVQIPGGCTTCHDVHKTVLDNVDGQDAGATTACTACHAHTGDAVTPQIDLTKINHPTGAGTPLEGVTLTDSTTWTTACQTCHMPGGQHIFRITTDPTYTEFPAAAKTANMAAPTLADADGYQVVWVDVDQACGQCHGGSAGVSGTKNGAPYLTKANLLQLAPSMHDASAALVNITTTTPPLWGQDKDGNPNQPILPPSSCTTPLSAGTSSMSATTVALGTGVTITDGSAGAGKMYINWGDGSAMEIYISGINGTYSHTFGNVGKYQVVQTWTNQCGQKVQKTYLVNVTGSNGKSYLLIKANGTFGTAPNGNPQGFTYKVYSDAAGSTIVTSGTLAPTTDPTTNYRKITLDSGTYYVKLSFPYSSTTGATAFTTYSYCVNDGTTTPATVEFNGNNTTQAGPLTTVDLTTIGATVTVSGTGCIQ